MDVRTGLLAMLLLFGAIVPGFMLGQQAASNDDAAYDEENRTLLNEQRAAKDNRDVAEAIEALNQQKRDALARLQQALAPMVTSQGATIDDPVEALRQRASQARLTSAVRERIVLAAHEFAKRELGRGLERFSATELGLDAADHKALLDLLRQ